jgi:hypothetical protein
MEVRFLSAALLSAVALIAMGPARAATTAPSVSALTQAQVIKRFERQTGRRLVPAPGHSGALALPKSATNLAFYGDFLLWVVGPGNLENHVAQLLTDVHTGELGTPGAAGIYWEKGTYFGGQPYWLGKKRYGTNLVLWHYGATANVDPPFKRLHKVLGTVLAG